MSSIRTENARHAVTAAEEARQCGEAPAGVRDVVGAQPGDLELRRHGVVDGDQVACAVTDAVHADVAGVGDDRAVRHRAHHGDRGADLRVPGSPAGGDDGLVGAIHHPLPVDQCAVGPRRTAQLVEQRRPPRPSPRRRRPGARPCRRRRRTPSSRADPTRPRCATAADRSRWPRPSSTPTCHVAAHDRTDRPSDCARSLGSVSSSRTAVFTGACSPGS